MAGKMKYKVGDEFSNHKRLIEYVGSHPKFRTSLWMWECMSCGKIYGPSLTNSITRLDRGPKCCFMPKGSKTGRWIGHEEITGVFYGQYRHDAKRKGRDFEVSIEELWNQWLAQDGKCIYTGRQLVHGVDASIDRIDSSLGYTIDNIQWVHRDINRMKSDFDESYFIEMCIKIARLFDN